MTTILNVFPSEVYVYVIFPQLKIEEMKSFSLVSKLALSIVQEAAKEAANRDYDHYEPDYDVLRWDSQDPASFKSISINFKGNLVTFFRYKIFIESGHKVFMDFVLNSPAWPEYFSKIRGYREVTRQEKKDPNDLKALIASNSLTEDSDRYMAQYFTILDYKTGWMKGKPPFNFVLQKGGNAVSLPNSLNYSACNINDAPRCVELVFAHPNAKDLDETALKTALLEAIAHANKLKNSTMINHEGTPIRHKIDVRTIQQILSHPNAASVDLADVLRKANELGDPNVIQVLKEEQAKRSKKS